MTSIKDIIGNVYEGKKVLVTGHTGFKGSWLVVLLKELGAEVIGISLEPNTSPNLFDSLKLSTKMKSYIQDIRKFNSIKEILEKEKPEIVFHLAAQPIVRESYENPTYTYETNVIGTANILEAIRKTDSVKAVVMITTDKVYKDKKWVWPYRENDELGGYDPYSSSKACAEIIINSYIQSFFNTEDYGIKHKVLVASARAGNVIGGGDWSRDRLIPDIVRAIYEKNEKVVLRNPSHVRPWQNIFDCLFGYLLLGKMLDLGKKEFVGSWNFSPNDEAFINVEELVKKGIGVLGCGEYVVKKDEGKHETEILKLDSTKAKNFLKWRPALNIDESLRFTFDWYRNYYKREADIYACTLTQIQEYINYLKMGVGKSDEI